ncbi:hypothetical protein TNCV_268911 [Trichonephila clavipes]|nr:hypothetical protein TNCV_268911 [Trichonephila clavipes]
MAFLEKAKKQDLVLLAEELEERVERETEEKIARQHAIQQLRWESELNARGLKKICVCKNEGTVDGYEWRCRNQSKDNRHDIVRV